MCGITGFVGKGDERDLKSMTRSLSHRGPDGEGIYIDSKWPVFLGSRRLSVRDIEGGAQPMISDDRQLVVVFNGEIYNAKELRLELEGQGHHFHSAHSDTEVLLHGFREWGAGLVPRLSGMWAFAILDLREQTLFLSRDRFGQKPLYLYQQGGTFAFSSEIRAFAKHRHLGLSLSAIGLHKYCAHGYFPGIHTLYHEVRKVRSGHNLTLDLRELRAHESCYWSYSIEPEGPVDAAAVDRWADEVRALLEQSVSRRLVSDVPLGVFLSGGLDSSAIGAIASARVPGKLETFSVGFDEPTFDETKEALAAARVIGSRHKVTTFGAQLLPTVTSEVFDRIDEPLSDSSMLSYYLLCKTARERVTVALGGDAGDELFAGYDPFHALRFADLIERALPSPVHRGIRSLLSRISPNHGYMSTRFKIDRTLRGFGHGPALWNPLWLAPVSPVELEELLGEPVELESLYSEAIEAWDGCSSDHPVDKSLEFFARVFLQDDILVKVDRMSMMHGLEVRSPFLDHDLVDCVRRIPHGLKLRGRTTKFILKKAMEPLLPASIVHRQKLGFSAPLGQWLADGAVSVDADALPLGWSPQCVRRRVQRHRDGIDDHRLMLWNMYALGEVIRRGEGRITGSGVRRAGEP